MLVSHRKKFIFTKTLKTAGTSVESYYEPFCMPEGLWRESHARDEYVSESGIIGYRRGYLAETGTIAHQGKVPSNCKFYNHMPANVIRDLLGEATWNGYFKFTVVRNPFSKLVSAWYHLYRPQNRLGSTLRSLACNPISLPWILSGKRDILDFRAWIQSGGHIDDRDKYLIDGQVCVDYFIKHETLLDDICEVNALLGIDHYERIIPRFKSGMRSQRFLIPDFYDTRTENLVRERYAWEFERFGYDMPKG